MIQRIRRRAAVPVQSGQPEARAYAQFVAGLKARIQSARTAAARAVNHELVLLYWDIGQAITDKQRTLGWGESVVEMLSRDLRRAFPGTSGFSVSSLWRMRQFYVVHSSPEFLAQAVRELGPCAGAGAEPAILAQAVRELLAAVPWGHHVELLNKVSDAAARLYYLRAAARLGWSRNVLVGQVRAGAWEHSRRAGKSHNFPAALSGHLAEQAEEMLKSRYNLEFLGLGRAIRERELEERLVGRLRDFILELGYGFCFVGRQHRLTLGRKEYFVDLLFYHRFLKALVAIDLKLGPFEPEFTGKMDFYLNLLNDLERAPDDRPSIGIVLCAEKDSLEVEFALKTKTNPIGVAEYQLRASLPAELRGRLPTPRQLTAAIRPLLPAAAKSLSYQPRRRVKLPAA